MSRAPSFAGVILAAGESSRMGADKALLPWPPTTPGQPPSKGTFLSAAIRSLSFSTDFIIVVAGKNEAAVAPVAYAEGASIVVNPDPARGQFSSLQVGLHEVLNRGRDAAMITLVDRPPANSATIQILRDAFEAAGNETWAVVPEFNGDHGHPFIAGRELIEAFLQAAPTATARDLEHLHQQHVVYVPVEDSLVAINVNTPDDYARLAALGS
ncbi:MAG TPA: nucleotidyltransferase family protein [Candidatus Sulfotelmatobacter sp.]|nr:nucleotidyltransferase family protein [Candidatus Sulfotelmatobacter sp.]